MSHDTVVHWKGRNASDPPVAGEEDDVPAQLSTDDHAFNSRGAGTHETNNGAATNAGDQRSIVAGAAVESVSLTTSERVPPRGDVPRSHSGWRVSVPGSLPQVLVAVVVLALIIGGLWRWHHSSLAATRTTSSTALIPLVTISVPHLEAVRTIVTFTGTLSARNDMPISVEGDGGRVSEVAVEAGDIVKRGQLLARLDTSVIEPQIVSLEASLEEIRASAELAHAEFQRAQKAKNVFSQEDMERRRSAALTADAKVKVGAAQLAEARARLQRSDIRAPSDGVVLSRTVEVGQTVVPGGSALFRLARDSEVEMRGQVAEQDLPSLALGQAVDVSITGQARVFKGRVRLLGPIIDPTSRLGTVRVALDPDPQLRPGAFARAQVVVGDAQRPVLPQTAVLSDENGNYVLILDAGNRVQRRAVQVAQTTAAGIVIGGGLSGDERVVSTAGAFLREGEPVKVYGGLPAS